MTKDEANELAKSYLLSGLPIAPGEEETPAMDAVVDGIKEVFDAHMPDIRKAIKRYLDDNDQDAFFIALLPFHNKIWYEAYSPYWLLHCTRTHQIRITPITTTSLICTGIGSISFGAKRKNAASRSCSHRPGDLSISLIRKHRIL